MFHKRVFPVILTIKRNLPEISKLLDHLSEKEFDVSQMDIFCGETTPNSSLDSTLNCIYLNHYAIVRSYAERCQNRKQHLMIMEDDCEFFSPPGDSLLEKISFLEARYPEWCILYVGHTPLGTTYPIGKDLVRTSVPFTAHCYILNFRHLESLMNRIPQHKWKRPWMVEGALALEENEKFAVFPSLATQNRLPRELKEMMPVAEHIGLAPLSNAMELFMFHPFRIGCFILLVLLLLLVCSSCRTSTQVKRTH